LLPGRKSKKKNKAGNNQPAGAPGEDRQKARVVFQLKDVTKNWSGEQGFELTVPELTIRQGEQVALVGFSGCGKSTLLDLLAMILRPDSAADFAFFTAKNKRLDVADTWQRKNIDGLAQARMRHIGYVLQTGGLLPFLSVYDNIALSRYGLGLAEQDAVEAVAEKLGIDRHLAKFPAQLSVGERQRVSIARAMAHEPSVVIADEPTASLDPINAEEIMGVFTRLTEEKGVTLVVATHEWDRVEELGFRRVKFNLEKDKATGSVRARVSG
jgi:putative ABC transport system ATP-binding protein